MRCTIRLRIIVTMGMALLLSLVVGLVGLYGERGTYAAVDDMYRNNLMAIVTLSAARAAVVDEREALGRSLLDPAHRDAAVQIKLAHRRLMEAWTRYDPALVAAGEERKLATAFSAMLAKQVPEVSREAGLLDAGKTEEARRLHVSKVAGALGDATATIDRLRAINAEQAADAAQKASLRYRHTWQLALAVLTLALTVLAGAAIVLIRAVTRPLERARRLAGAIAQGRLGNATLIAGNDELSDTLHSLDTMDGQLASIVARVRDVAEQVAAAARDLSQGNDDLSQRTQAQASSLEQTAAAMEALSITVAQNAQGAGRVRELASRMQRRAEDGRHIADSAVSAMDAITQASRQVGEIVQLIDEIAFQTHLLALNAAVEAARAGEHGRGFAVVAGEVRVLAQRSGASARNVRSLIRHATDKVFEGATLVQRTGQALNEIAGDVRDVGTVIEVIAAASEQQAAGIEQVNQAVTALDQATQQNAALVEEASAAGRHTLELSRVLMSQVAYFTLQSKR